MTMTLIASTTVGSGGASSIDFTSIPQTYTDLYLVIHGRTTRSGSDVDGNRLNFNSSTTGYTNRLLFGNGAAVFSNTDTNATAGNSTGAANTANTFGSSGVYIPNYTSSNNKSFTAEGVGENNATGAFQFVSGALWSNVAAITSISIKSESGSDYVQHSTATLYGILKGSDGIVTTTTS